MSYIIWQLQLMAWPCRCVSLTLTSLIVLSLTSQSCYGLGTFGYDIHHRFSDPVKGIMGNILHLPQKGTPQYYAAMVHRDRFFKGRRLAADSHTPLTFAAGNHTLSIPSLGFLHYANVSIGTPPLWFLVALETGSDLFWLPCNCTSCVHGLKTRSGRINFNIYELDNSSTSKKVSCNNSSFCKQSQCPSSDSSCPYQVDYLSNDTSSSGFLVEDVLHLITDDDQTKDADAIITFGCGQVQTGVLLKGEAPNGLFGLGMDNISVPSILAKEGLISNSFSMCFGSNGSGRIAFGDTGVSDQGKTPFNLKTLHPTYNITITQIIVGGNAADLEFHAIFDSGTSFTYINDPAYTLLADKFSSLVKEKRHSFQSPDSNIPFEYCYEISPNQTIIEVPLLNLTMKGGDDYYVSDPTIQVSSEDEGNLLCLGILKSDSVNIIGQNFMTGYKIVFDRENMKLGWKESNCEFSDPVKGIMGNILHLPQKGTSQYYAAMAHRDRFFKARSLAADSHTPLTFAAGNHTLSIPSLGFLHYANVSIVNLNAYDLDKSSTSKKVSCNNSSFCKQKQCPSSGSSCRYQVDYLSNDTSSSGFLVEDVLHLITDDDQTKDADTFVTFGCGQVQTGVFLRGAALNGLFGLGMGNISVPSILAKEGLISNSFSMCFGYDRVGRITFGDTGGPDQGKTPFNLGTLHPTYNITITQIIVEGRVADLEFHAIFDSGTSFTYINDPAYTLLSEKFNSQVKAKRHSSQSPVSNIPFEYCYEISPNQTIIEFPVLNLTMKGGDDYYVKVPIELLYSEDEGNLFCLGMHKSDSVNIIGQNFMTGYKIVFDRDNMNLGYDDVLSNTSPINPSLSPAVSPAIAVNPVATSNPSINPPNRSFRIKPTFIFMMLLFPLSAIF
ncbi:Aspartyl protease family protein 1, partial [Mucuna pruriens]